MRFTIIILLLLSSFTTFGQSDFNIELLAHVDVGESSSDIWGYVDQNGIEYAIIGLRTSTQVYSLENPSNPILRGTFPGTSSSWRDIKTYENYAYVVADQGEDGLVIIDMSGAPGTITSQMISPTLGDSTIITKCHNHYIDESSGILFLSGCQQQAGVTAFDLKENPLNPSFITNISTNYSHDVFVQDNLVYASEINSGLLAIYDIEDLFNSTLLGVAKTTNFFTHNAWASDDNNFVFTTDEVSNGTIDAFDITDKSNPVKVDAFVPESIKNQGSVPHNTHFLDNYLITSWYDYGIVITDVTNPNKIIETGHFETKGASGADCWGAYPFLPSGLILASDIANGLFVLKPNYERAVYLEGAITDSETGNPIVNANIKIVSNDPNQGLSNTEGKYTTGQTSAGIFAVEFDHPAYDLTTVEVELKKGETIIQDVQLLKSNVSTQTITIVDDVTGEALIDAEVSISNYENNYGIKTNSEGIVSVEVTDGIYSVIVGKWGYKYNELTLEANGEQQINVALKPGYVDDFLFDFGWSTVAPNQRSEWVRVKPIATFYAGEASNPGKDLPDDLGEYCFVTGNATGGAGVADVDGGTSKLMSPSMDLSNSSEAVLSYSAWFFNDGGSGTTPNDTLKIFVTNGADTTLLESIFINQNNWDSQSIFPLQDHILLTDNVQIIYEATDDENDPHLVEAAIDGFSVEYDIPSSSDEISLNLDTWKLTPNPVMEKINLVSNQKYKKVDISIYSMEGKLINKNSLKNVSKGEQFSILAPGENGMYFLMIQSGGQFIASLKFIRI